MRPLYETAVPLLPCIFLNYDDVVTGHFSRIQALSYSLFLSLERFPSLW